MCVPHTSEMDGVGIIMIGELETLWQEAVVLFWIASRV
jgi:hypothetical protein